MAEPTLSGEPTTALGQIAGGVIFGLGLLSTGGLALWQYFSQRKEKAKPDYAIMEAAEIADMAPARELVRTLSPKLEKVFRLVDQLLDESAARSRKMDLILEKLQHLENEQEITKRAREEVARQLSAERDWDKRRGPAE